MRVTNELNSREAVTVTHYNIITNSEDTAYGNVSQVFHS